MLIIIQQSALLYSSASNHYKLLYLYIRLLNIIQAVSHIWADCELISIFSSKLRLHKNSLPNLKVSWFASSVISALYCCYGLYCLCFMPWRSKVAGITSSGVPGREALSKLSAICRLNLWASSMLLKNMQFSASTSQFFLARAVCKGYALWYYALWLSMCIYNIHMCVCMTEPFSQLLDLVCMQSSKLHWKHILSVSQAVCVIKALAYEWSCLAKKSNISPQAAVLWTLWKRKTGLSSRTMHICLPILGFQSKKKKSQYHRIHRSWVQTLHSLDPKCIVCRPYTCKCRGHQINGSQTNYWFDSYYLKHEQPSASCEIWPLHWQVWFSGTTLISWSYLYTVVWLSSFMHSDSDKLSLTVVLTKQSLLAVLELHQVLSY